MKTKRLYLVLAGLLLGLVTSGCRERNPAYIASKDASAMKDTAPDVLGADSVPRDAFIPPDDGPTIVPRRDVGVGPDTPGLADVPNPVDDGGVDDLDARDARRTGDDVPPGDTVIGGEVARDVADVGTRVDANDAPAPPLDGGVDGPSLDTAAVDAPPVCLDQQTRACTTPGNPLLGACRAGTQTCTGGDWGACTGEVLPATTELCNGLDDNCNGMTDEGCTSECVVVAPSGDDSTADGTAANPFATVAAGLAFATDVDGGGPRRVCVAGGATCSDSNSYPMASTLSVPSGARVQGNYALEGSTLSYCAGTQPPTTALQFTADGASVVFGDGVTLHTELGGFVIERFSPSSGAASSGSTTAVFVSGGKNITLSEIFVTDAPAGDTTYGVDVENGGQVTIVASSIGGGAGRLSAVGVYVNGGSVSLRGNCDAITQGVCATTCRAAGSVLGIRGRSGVSLANNAADSSAVYVTAASPGAASTIVANTLCGGPGAGNGDVQGANVATLRCEGGVCANVTGNAIGGGTGPLTLAVSLSGGSARVDSNAIEAGCGSEGAAGVLLSGSSARLLNNRIAGSECSTSVTPGNGPYVGVRAVLTAGTGEPDLSSNDIDPRGATGDCQSTGLAIERNQGQPAPAGIFRNNIIAAGTCRTRTAISEGSNATGRIIENNDLYAEPATSGTGGTTLLFHRGNTDATTAAQVNALIGAAANISAAPKFVSYPNDLHLTSTSPCIDQGTAEGAPPDDADGLPRPQGAGFDIGAYEFPGS